MKYTINVYRPTKKGERYEGSFDFPNKPDAEDYLEFLNESGSGLIYKLEE